MQYRQQAHESVRSKINHGARTRIWLTLDQDFHQRSMTYQSALLQAQVLPLHEPESSAPAESRDLQNRMLAPSKDARSDGPSWIATDTQPKKTPANTQPRTPADIQPRKTPAKGRTTQSRSRQKKRNWAEGTPKTGMPCFNCRQAKRKCIRTGQSPCEYVSALNLSLFSQYSQQMHNTGVALRNTRPDIPRISSRLTRQRRNQP